MQRLTAKLTLVAYLIGGWVIPTLHHHGVDHNGGVQIGHVDCGAHRHVQTDGEDHGASNAPAGTATCSHSHAGKECLDGPASGDQPEALELRSQGSVDCHGLCALCVARSLCSQRLSESNSAGEVILFGETPLATTPVLLQRARGNVSSRGPPLFV